MHRHRSRSVENSIIAINRGLIFVLGLSLTRCSAQDARVTLNVVAPSSTPKNASLFIAGNHPSLGDWDPGKTELAKRNDSSWTGEFSFPRGFHLEYKITRGGWNSQAIYDQGVIPGNCKLLVTGDTSIVVRPKTWSDINLKSAGRITGTVKYHKAVKGNGLKYARDVIVWLPPSYDKERKKHYPVLYAHDGQNLFDPATSFIGYDWQIDEVADSLIRRKKIEEIIVVGIYNSSDRIQEYSDTELGRNYANFVVKQLKPLIDSTYRTKPDRENTAVMGSSMGGLISFLLVWWYPEVFSKAACLSSVFDPRMTHIVAEVRLDAGQPKQIRIYLDCGGAGGDESLKPGMDEMVNVLKQKGYGEGVNVQVFYDEAAEHNERAWAARVWRPLTFFFGL